MPKIGDSAPLTSLLLETQLLRFTFSRNITSGWQTRQQTALSSFSTSVSPNMIVLPFNRCHDSSQYCPLSSLSASCNDSAGIFKRFSDTAFSFFFRFFHPHFLTISIRAFVSRGKSFRPHFLPHQAKFFCTLTLSFFFFFLLEATGRLSSYFISCLLHNTPFDNAGIGTQSISCKNIRAPDVAWYFRRCWRITVNHNEPDALSNQKLPWDPAEIRVLKTRISA